MPHFNVSLTIEFHPDRFPRYPTAQEFAEHLNGELREIYPVGALSIQVTGIGMRPEDSLGKIPATKRSQSHGSTI